MLRPKSLFLAHQRFGPNLGNGHETWHQAWQPEPRANSHASRLQCLLTLWRSVILCCQQLINCLLIRERCTACIMQLPHWLGPTWPSKAKFESNYLRYQLHKHPTSSIVAGAYRMAARTMHVKTHTRCTSKYCLQTSRGSAVLSRGGMHTYHFIIVQPPAGTQTTSQPCLGTAVVNSSIVATFAAAYALAYQ